MTVLPQDILTLRSEGRIAINEGQNPPVRPRPVFTRRAAADDCRLRELGGWRLVIGVADDGTVVGVQDPLAEEERVASLIDDRISPQLVPAIDLVTLADKTVLVVDVPLSTRRPHYITRQGAEAGVYVRLGSTTRQADPALVAELERNARGIAFENLPEPRATLEDLDLQVLSELRGRDTSADDLLALGLAAKQGDQTVPTNAGILAACPDPTRFLSSAWVQCGRLRGPHGTDIFDQTEIHGPMALAVDPAVEFLLKHAYKTAVFGEVRRRDVYSIPIEPIREAIVSSAKPGSWSSGVPESSASSSRWLRPACPSPSLRRSRTVCGSRSTCPATTRPRAANMRTSRAWMEVLQANRATHQVSAPSH